MRACVYVCVCVFNNPEIYLILISYYWPSNTLKLTDLLGPAAKCHRKIFLVLSPVSYPLDLAASQKSDGVHAHTLKW